MDDLSKLGSRNVHTGDDPTAHQLRLVLTLAEELHFGRAASRLYLTQPALSQQIRSLEQRLGVELFARTSRHVELTEAGRMLLPLAKNVVDASDALRNAVLRAKSGGSRLRLGLCESFAALAPTRAVIAAVSARHPDLGPDVHVVDSFDEQLTMLTEGRIDAAFVHLPVPEGLHARALLAEPRLACVADTDPLADRSSVRLADLAHHTVVSLASFRAARDFWTADPRPDGLPVLHSDLQVTRFESLLAAVTLGGSTTAFVPASAARLYPRPDLRYLPVTDLPDCEFGVVWHSSAHGNPTITALEKALTDHDRRGDW